MPPLQASRELDAATVPEHVRSPKAKLVYFYLAVAGDGSVEELCDHLDLTRLDVYSILDTFQTADIVTEQDGVYAPAA